MKLRKKRTGALCLFLTLVMLLQLLPLNLLGSLVTTAYAEESTALESSAPVSVQEDEVLEEQDREPRSLSELRALDGVVLSKDGAVERIPLESAKQMTQEELTMLFSPDTKKLRQFSATESATESAMESAMGAETEASLMSQLGMSENEILLSDQDTLEKETVLSELDTLLSYQDMYNLSDEANEQIKTCILHGMPAADALSISIAVQAFQLDFSTVLNAYQSEQEQAASDGENKSSAENDEEKAEALELLSLRTALPYAICQQLVDMTQESVETLLERYAEQRNSLYITPEQIETDQQPMLKASVASSDDIAQNFVPDRLLDAPFSFYQNGKLDVNLNNGEYLYTETDLSLPGKNGLDLDITRIFDSSTALTVVPYGYTQDRPTTYVADVGYDIYQVTSFNPVTVKKVTDLVTLQDSAVQQIVAGTRFHYSGSGTVFAGNGEVYPDTVSGAMLYYNDLMEWDCESGGNLGALFAASKSGAYIVSPRITPENTSSLTNSWVSYKYHLDEFGLGHGWRLGFSAIERYLSGPIDLGSSNFQSKYRLILSDGRKFELDESGNFEHYTLDDMVLVKSGSGYPGAAWTLTYRDGKTEYFDGNGRIIATVDRFGNQITYAYTLVNGQVNKIVITDTLGREVVYQNENIDPETYQSMPVHDGSVKYNYKWTLSLDGALIRTYYSKQPTDSTSARMPRSLLAVSNELGEFTKYESSGGTSYFNVYLPTRDSNSDGFGYRAKIGRVEYADGSALELDQSSGKERMGISGYGTANPVSRVYYEDVEEIGTRKVMTQYTIGDIYRMLPQYNLVNTNHAYSSSVRKTLYMHDGGDGENYYSIPYRETNAYFDSDHLKEYETTSVRNVNNAQEETFQSVEDIQVPWDDTTLALVSEQWFQYNNDQLPTKITTKQYNDSYLTGNQTARSYTQSYVYNTYGEMTSETRPDGQNITTTYQNYGFPNTRTYKKDNNTIITERTLLSGDKKSIAKTTTEANDSVCAATAYAYDSFGEVTSVQTYDSQNSYTQTDYRYDNSAQPVTVKAVGITDASGALVPGSDGFDPGVIASTYHYDNRGRVTSMTDGLGNATSYEYDAAGRVIRVHAPDQGAEEYVYTYDYTTSNNNTVRYTNASGYTVENRYDYFGNLVEVYDLTNSVLLEKDEYDHLNRLIRKTDYTGAAGAVVYYFFYDAFDRLIESGIRESADSRTPLETYQYFDGEQKVVHTQKGENGAPDVVTTESRDVMGNVVSTSTKVSGVEKTNTYTYDYLGNKVQEKTAYTADRGGSYSARYTYDALGNVLTQTNADGGTASHTYDWLGRQLSATDFRGNTSYFTYDAASRLLEEQHPFEQVSGSTVYAKTRYAYDQNGNLTSKQQSNNAPGSAAADSRVDYAYDCMNRLTQTASFDDGAAVSYTQYYYDKAGNLLRQYTGQTSPLTITGLDQVSGTSDYAVTKYTYDSRSQLTALTDALGQTEQYTYDLAGSLLSKTDRNGATTAYDYDSRGNLLTTTAGTGSQQVVIHNTYYANGALKSAASGGVSTTYTYNDMGLVAKEEENTGIARFYIYDAAGNRQLMTVTKNGTVQFQVRYAYDNLGRLYQVTNNGSVIATYTYDANGNRSSLSYDNGVTATYGYNLSNLVTSLTNKQGTAVLSQYAYTYLLDGNQSSKTDQTGLVTSYTYDGLGRLTGEQESTGQCLAYGYDSFGNRTSLTATGPESYTTAYQYDRNNRLTTEAKAQGGDTLVKDYQYDANGNTVSILPSRLTDPSGGTSSLSLNADLDGATLNQYDGLNRLVQVETGDTTATYTYRPDGLRNSKTVNGVTTTQVWDGSNLVMELTGDAVTGKYLRGVGLIAADLGGTRSYYLYNAHGDVTGLTNTAGTMTQSYDYDAFGNEKTASSESDTNPFRYCGEYLDAETGSYYLRARYYDPTIGRFLTEDTVKGETADPLSLNLYTYCYNNPIINTDPSGHDPSFYYNEEMGKWRFVMDNKGLNVTISIFGIVPFLDNAIWGATDLLAGTKTITQDMYQDIATKIGASLSVASTTASALGKSGSKLVKSIGNISNIITAANILYEAFDDRPYYNEITGRLFSGYYESTTFDLTSEKFLMYSTITEDLINQGVVTYKKSFGSLDSYKVDWDKFDAYFEKLGMTAKEMGDLLK